MKLKSVKDMKFEIQILKNEIKKPAVCKFALIDSNLTPH